MAVNKNFKKCIEKVKYEFSITQKEIAYKLKVHNTYLSDMINGRVPLTDQISNKIYELFQIEITAESEEKPLSTKEKANEVSESITLYTCQECVNKQKEIDLWKSKFYALCDESREVERKYRELLEAKIELKKETPTESLTPAV